MSRMQTIIWLGLALNILSATGNVFYAEEGQKFTMQCGISHYTDYVEWKYKNVKIFSSRRSSYTVYGQSPIRPRSRPRGETDIEINPVKKEDAGQFTCTVDAKTQQYTLFVYSASISPSRELQVGSNATLQCEVAGQPQKPTVNWKDPNEKQCEAIVQLNPVKMSHAGTWVCEFTYDIHTFSHKLVINVAGPVVKSTPSPTVSSKSNQGESVPGKFQPGGQKNNGLYQLPWWVWAAAGSGGLFVILLIVFVVALYKTRQKKRLLKMNAQKLPKKFCQCDCPTAAAKPLQGRQKGRPSSLRMEPLINTAD